MTKKTSVFSLKVASGFHPRLTAAAKKTKMPKALFAIQAMEAAIEAVERSGSIRVPIAFAVVPAKPEDDRFKSS